LNFRVAEFRVNLKLKKKFPKIGFRLSAGALEQQLNGGRIPLGAKTEPVALTLSECIAGGDKFKTRDGDCSAPGKRVGYLSRPVDQIYEVPRGKVFTLDKNSFVGIAEHAADDTLTPREIDVLRLIASGNANKEIG